VQGAGCKVDEAWTERKLEKLEDVDSTEAVLARSSCVGEARFIQTSFADIASFHATIFLRV
jgi:ribosomal protein L12E/L44/L45/RPP1/RPP2